MLETPGLSDWQPDRNLGLELVRATEAAAIRATPFVGRGDKNAADGAAVDAMRRFFIFCNYEWHCGDWRGRKRRRSLAV